jgi:hypothetical protein
MTFPRVTWKRALLVGALAALGWLAYRTCPCIIQTDDESSRFRVTSQPNDCVVFQLQDFWALPDSTPAQSASEVEYYELRRSRQVADELFIGLRSMKPYQQPGIVLRAKNKFAFRFHAGDSPNRPKVDGIRSATEPEWDDSETLPYLDTGDFLDIDLRGNVEGNNIVFKGQRFPKSERYPDFSTRRMASVKETFIAIPSFAGPAIPPGSLFSFNVDVWRRAETVDFYQVSTRMRVARLRGWTCIGGLGQPRLIVWHGDQLFSMPLTLDKRDVLLCDFRGR